MKLRVGGTKISVVKKKVKEMRWFLKFRKKSSFSVQFSIGDRVFIFKKINSSIVSEIYDVPIHGEVCNFPTKFSNMVIIDKGIWCCNKGTLILTKFLVSIRTPKPQIICNR